MFLVCICIALVACTDPHVHTWKTEITVQPECEKAGEATKTCVECGATEKEAVAATGHKEGVEKVVVQPGCTPQGPTAPVCPASGQVFSSTKTDPVGHKPGTLTMIKAPTCTEGGEEDSVCTVCGIELGHRDLPALGHDVEHAEKEILTEPTCETDGKANLICPVCHQQFDVVTIEKLGHLWETSSISKVPSCTEEGKAEQVCTRDPSHKRNVLIAKVDHVYTGASSIKIQPTCITTGEMITSCINCDAYITTTIPKTGHSMPVEPTRKEKEATDFEEGIGIWKCENCDYEETRVIPMLHVHKTINDELPPWDDSNQYGENEPGTCVSPGKIYAFCYCYVDDEGNHYLEDGVGRHHYKLVDPETGEAYYKEGSVDLNNHVNYGTKILEGKGYFSAGTEARYCLDCGGDRTVYAIEGDKYSADGKWNGSVEGNVVMYQNEKGASVYGDFEASFDIEAYPNGIDIFSYQGGFDDDIMDIGEEIMMSGEMSGENTSLMRTTDGRWISIWGTGIDSYTDLKRFDLINGNDMAMLYVMDDSPSEQRITFILYGATPIEDSLVADSTRQELPSIKGVVGIDADGLDVLSSYSKNEDGTNVISIAKGTEVKLNWFPLTNESPSTVSWTENGSASATGQSCTMKANSGTVTVTCTAMGETNTFIVKFI